MNEECIGLRNNLGFSVSLTFVPYDALLSRLAEDYGSSSDYINKLWVWYL